MTGGCARREKGISYTAACEFSVHPNQIRLWRNHLMEQLPKLISTRRPQQEKAREELEAELFLQIGQLKMEIEWLKKDYRRSGHDETG
jgi:putative transposase